MWTSLFVPLVKGLDLSKEATLGEDELHTALNVDYGADGAIKGRPSRADADQFYVLDPAYQAWTAPTYKAAADFDDTGFTAAGLVRIRDGAGERAALATHGRLFYHEGSKWHDRGAFGCMRVDRINYSPDETITAPATNRRLIAQNFSHSKDGFPATFSEQWTRFSSTGAIEQRDLTTASGSYVPGTAARKDTVTAAVLVDTTSNALDFFVSRPDVQDGKVLLTATLANDARTPTDVGDAPVICPSASGNFFYVIYRTTTANTFKVLKVDFSGITDWTYTVVQAGLQGIWVDNTVGNVCVAFTNATGITIRQLNPSTGVQTGVDCTDATGAGADCVVGAETSGQAWWAYRAGASYGDLAVGVAVLGSGTTSRRRLFYGLNVSYPEASLRWAICHQPVKLNGRMYLSLACSAAEGFTATWLTLDLTNWFTTTAQAQGPFRNPTIVARGPTSATYPHLQPSVASTLSDGTGFTFPTIDWQTFAATTSLLTGLTAQGALNKVSFSKPRAASIGESVVFSGSVPRMTGRGDCVELGWPFLAGEPALSATSANAGGTIPDGTYSVQAVWKWTDEAGQIHRSAPSPIRSVAVAAPNSTIVARVVGPWLTEKEDRAVLEVYVNSLSATSTYTLQGTADWVPDLAAGVATAITITSLVSGREELYSDGDVLPNYHVPGDGGLAAVGRRLWLASANAVYASKLWTPGYGPEFNDDAANDQPSLFVNVPANAGRVVSLEAMDDKLVVFCERGIYLIQDGGPNNVGVGSDFAPPLRISDLSIAGPRSSCVTDAGILFCTTLDTTDALRGGPWLIDRQFTFTERQYLGRQAADYHLRSSSWVPEVAYSPERQQAFITTNVANGTSHGVVVIDLRVGKWSVWDTISGTTGSLQSIACVSGVLWALNAEPSQFNGAPGTDLYPAAAYPMVVKTSHLSANGNNGLGWSRVRSASPLEADGSGAHSVTMTAVLDKTRTLTSGAISLAASSADTTWPTTRQAPEWRLPSQKCASLQLQLSASPATARWAAIRLEVAPLPLRAPAKNRS